jgi:hypothetical protein
MEDPLTKAADIAAAAAFLADRNDIDPARIGGLGICAGSAYLATAATQTDLIKSVALIAPALPSRETTMTTLGGQPGVDALLEMARDTEEQFARTGVEQLVPAVQPTTEPGADYYSNPDRGLIPEWDNTFNPMSWLGWLEYDAQVAASRLTQPLAIVHSSRAASPESIPEFVAKVAGPVEQLWLDDVTQYDFYDQPTPMKTASDAVALHFERTLR